MNEILFTSSAVADLLMQIEELSDKDISLSQVGDEIQIAIGESTYTIDTNNSTDVEVDESVVEDVIEINNDGFDDIDESGVGEMVTVPIEGGLIKEALKTLLVGGLVRLTTKLLQK